MALLLALVGVAGSLFLSLGLGLKACPLCFYQRAFMLGLVGVLTLGLFVEAARSPRPGLLALPLAVAGLGVALFHVWLEWSGKLECPPGVLGLGSAPQQSLAMFVLLTALLLADLAQGDHPLPGLVGGLVLGALLAFGSCVANPPMPQPPSQPYQQPPEICRPPHQQAYWPAAPGTGRNAWTS